MERITLPGGLGMLTQELHLSKGYSEISSGNADSNTDIHTGVKLWVEIERPIIEEPRSRAAGNRSAVGGGGELSGANALAGFKNTECFRNILPANDIREGENVTFCGTCKIK